MAKTYQPHIVRQGEHLDRLAFLRGADPDEVWNDPSNADIKAKRASKDVLYPGDVVHLPEGEQEGLALEQGTTNRYTADVPKRTLRVTVNSQKGPYANEPYEVHGLPSRPGAAPPKGTTGANGEVELSVPILLREIGVFLPNPNITYLFRIGDVDPMSEPTGAQKRLENLGYLEPGTPHDPEAVEAALRAFQHKNGLPVTGQLDQATQNKLVEASGQCD